MERKDYAAMPGQDLPSNIAKCVCEQFAQNEGSGGVNEKAFDMAVFAREKRQMSAKQAQHLEAMVRDCTKHLSTKRTVDEEGLPIGSPLEREKQGIDVIPAYL